MVRAARIVGGILLILIGLVGWVLPIVPGWLFMIAGLALLSRHFHWARRLRAFARARVNSARRKLRGPLPANPSPGDRSGPGMALTKIDGQG